MAAFYTRRERKNKKRPKSASSSAYLKRFNILIISGRFLFFYLVQSQPCWFDFYQFMQYAYGAVRVTLTLNRMSLMMLTIVVRLSPNATDIFFVIKKNETKQ